VTSSERNTMFNGVQNQITEKIWIGNHGDSKELVVKTTMILGRAEHPWYQWDTVVHLGTGISKVQFLHKIGNRIEYNANQPILEIEHAIKEWHQQAKEQIAYQVTSMRNRIMRLQNIDESFSSVSFPFGEVTALYQNYEDISVTIYDRLSLVQKSSLMLGLQSNFILFKWKSDEKEFAVFDEIVKTLM